MRSANQPVPEHPSGTVLWTRPDDQHFAAAAALFDKYRTHYGEPPAPTGTRTWLAEQVTTGPVTGLELLNLSLAEVRRA
jgi:hypothetical protein